MGVRPGHHGRAGLVAAVTAAVGKKQIDKPDGSAPGCRTIESVKAVVAEIKEKALR
ncbi:hypothetical protein [Streptomyces hydrogenans]|uniref:hypothetical protein n=1 Tax=Streptomyces hydrogenans TaxID=1873719 RepID=UPI003440C64D